MGRHRSDNRDVDGSAIQGRTERRPDDHDAPQARGAGRSARAVRIPWGRAAPDRSRTGRVSCKEGRGMNDDERRERGTKIRREVLGDEYVDRIQSTATSLTKEFQALSTRDAWGD